MAEFILRPAAENDLVAIRALIRDSRINPFGLDWRRFIVATTSEDIFAGCGQIKQHGDGSRELASIAVVPEYRENGVARMIIVRLLALNPPPLYLMCRSGLEPFYEKFNFHSLNYSEMPSYFQRMSRLSELMLHLAQSSEHLSIMRLDKEK